MYNFKKDSKVYIVQGNDRYRLDVYPDLTFSQTFEETAVVVKTLHRQSNMFDKAVITKANPANFSFTIPLIKQSDMRLLFNLLVNYDTSSSEVVLKTFDIYVESNSEVHKIEKCVLESGVFQIVRDRILALSVSGTGRKLSKYTGTIPGTLYNLLINPTYSAANALEVTLNGTVQANVSTISLEVQNKVSWVDYTTIQNSLNVTTSDTSMYPEVFVVSGRVLSGSITQYVLDTNSTSVNTWKNETPLRIRVGLSSGVWLLDTNIPTVVYTNRLDIQDLYMQSYDFRMTHSPNDLADIISYNTL